MRKSFSVGKLVKESQRALERRVDLSKVKKNLQGTKAFGTPLLGSLHSSLACDAFYQMRQLF